MESDGDLEEEKVQTFWKRIPGHQPWLWHPSTVPHSVILGLGITTLKRLCWFCGSPSYPVGAVFHLNQTPSTSPPLAPPCTRANIQYVHIGNNSTVVTDNRWQPEDMVVFFPLIGVRYKKGCKDHPPFYKPDTRNEGVQTLALYLGELVSALGWFVDTNRCT